MRGVAGRPLRVCHILESYPPDYGGGAAITTRDICRALALRGHEIQVVCTENSGGAPYARRTEYDGSIRVERINLPYFRTSDPDGWKLGLIKWIEHERRVKSLIDELIDELQPDVVDYHTSRPLGEECLSSIARRGVPIVATLHEGWLICPRLMLLRSPKNKPCSGPGPIRCLECLYSNYDGTHAKAAIKLPWRIIKLGALPAYRLSRRKTVRRNVTGAMARSDFMARVHQPHLEGQIQHIPLGIDLAEFRTGHPERPRAPLRFGFFGGFQQTKGIWDVLDAAEALKAKNLEFKLLIWGPGCESAPDEIAKRGLEDRVLLRGMYAPRELGDVYSEIDVALMATIVSEPFGRIPLEAAAAGAPTIAPAIGGITETIRDGIDGFLYKFRDPRDLEEKMRRVLQEPGLVGRLIQSLRPVPHTYDRVENVEHFYYQVLGITSNSLAGVTV